MNESESKPQEAPDHTKIIKIFVNGREETVTKEKLSYEEVVALAYPSPDFGGNTYKVTYFRKEDKHEGVLTKGESITAKDGMSFTVIRAVRS
jgi:hypothetical protein